MKRHTAKYKTWARETTGRHAVHHEPFETARQGRSSRERRQASGCVVIAVHNGSCSPIRVPAAFEAVHAGFPSVAQDYFGGDFSLDQHVIVHPETTYIVTVAGDSMQGAGIWDGDLLVVDRALQPQTGDVVVAILDDELTVKRLLVHGSMPILHAENPQYPDFIPEDGQTLIIWGVVTGNFHSQSPNRRDTGMPPRVTRPRQEPVPPSSVAPGSTTHYDSYGWVR